MASALLSILRGYPQSDHQRNYQSVPTDTETDALAEDGYNVPTTDMRFEEDEASTTYLAFWIMGAGTILGWSALISTFPFLASLYPSSSSIGQNLPSILSTVYCLGQLFFLGTAQSAVGQTSPTPRLRWSLLLLLSIFLLATFPLLSLILPYLSSHSSSEYLLTGLILLLTFTLNFSTSYFQSSILALASLWGSTEVLAAMSGQGGVAVLISLAQVSLAIIGALSEIKPIPSSVVASEMTQIRNKGEGAKPSTLAAIGLWALGSIGVGLCILALRYLQNHPTYDRITSSSSSAHKDLASGILPSTAPALHRRSSSSSGLSVGASSGQVSRSHSRDRTSTQTRTIKKGQGKENDGGWSRTKRVLRKNRLLYTAVGLDFAVTLAVFPAITSLIVSTHIPLPRLLKPDVFIPLHFLIFNTNFQVGDYLGRTYLPSRPFFLVTSHPKVLLLSLSRIIFIPLFLACNISTRTSSAPSGVGGGFIQSDLVYLLVLLAFGASNGYLGSLCIIVSSTPSLNPKLDEDEKDVAGTLGVFCLMAGLSTGSIGSFGVNWLVRR